MRRSGSGLGGLVLSAALLAGPLPLRALPNALEQVSVETLLDGLDSSGSGDIYFTAPSGTADDYARLVEGEDLRAALARAVVRVDIDLRAQRLTLREKGAPGRVFKISSGKAGHRTPTGCFIVDKTARMAYSAKYGRSPMSFSVFFRGRGLRSEGATFGIHGTPHVGSLGQAASHGCVRLRPDHARRVFEAVRRNDPDNTLKNALICIWR